MLYKHAALCSTGNGENTAHSFEMWSLRFRFHLELVFSNFVSQSLSCLGLLLQLLKKNT